MAYSKKEEFNEEEIKLAGFAKALSHPARIAIIKILVNKKCICGDIVSELPLSQSTVSQHLKELKEAGLIQGEVDGPRVCYCIDKRNWEMVSKAFSAFTEEVLSIKCNC